MPNVQKGASIEPVAQKCKQCDKCFSDMSYLLKHYRKTHPDVKYEADFPPKQTLPKHQEKPAEKPVETVKAMDPDVLLNQLKADLQSHVDSNLNELQ